jgi:hypothetical protein
VILAALAGEVLHVGAGPASFAVVDGDTLRRDKVSYRLLGIDAAEIHRAQCDAERRLGERIKHRLEAVGSGGAPPRSADQARQIWPVARAPARQRRGRGLRADPGRLCAPLARAARGLVHDLSLAQQDDAEPEACATTSSMR